MLKQVDLYLIPDDQGCQDVMEFLERHDFKLNIRDVSTRPLSVDEIAALVRHLNLRHFLNPSSRSFAKRKLDKELPSRREMIEMMAGDNDLIRKPIIVSGRLMVIGPNRHKIMEMLQIKPNGSDPSADAANGKSSSGK
jgi:arsenate reductase-like glutaredoxin family protein